MYDQYQRPKFFSLNYSEEQLSICLKQDKHFRANTYKGEPYTEMNIGPDDLSCKSNFDDASVIISGDMELYEDIKSDIEYL